MGLYEFYRAKTEAKKRLDDIEKEKALLKAEALAMNLKRKSSSRSPDRRHSSSSSRQSYTSSPSSSNSSDYYPRRKGKYKRSIRYESDKSSLFHMLTNSFLFAVVDPAADQEAEVEVEEVDH